MLTYEQSGSICKCCLKTSQSSGEGKRKRNTYGCCGNLLRDVLFSTFCFVFALEIDKVMRLVSPFLIYFSKPIEKMFNLCYTNCVYVKWRKKHGIYNTRQNRH